MIKFPAKEDSLPARTRGTIKNKTGGRGYRRLQCPHRQTI